MLPQNISQNRSQNLYPSYHNQPPHRKGQGTDDKIRWFVSSLFSLIAYGVFIENSYKWAAAILTFLICFNYKKLAFLFERSPRGSSYSYRPNNYLQQNYRPHHSNNYRLPVKKKPHYSIPNQSYYSHHSSHHSSSYPKPPSHPYKKKKSLNQIYPMNSLSTSHKAQSTWYQQKPKSSYNYSQNNYYSSTKKKPNSISNQSYSSQHSSHYSSKSSYNYSQSSSYNKGIPKKK